MFTSWAGEFKMIEALTLPPILIPKNRYKTGQLLKTLWILLGILVICEQSIFAWNHPVLGLRMSDEYTAQKHTAQKHTQMCWL